MSACTVANWSFNFLVSFTFLSLTTSIGKDWTFWLYAIVGVAAFVFFLLKVPETKGKTLEQIEQELSGDRASSQPGRTAHA